MQETLFGIPVSAWLGGIMIGLAAVGLFAFLGRIAGISGIFFASFGRDGGLWRWLFLAGIPLGGGVLAYFMPTLNGVTRPNPGVVWLIVAGFLVGWGTRMGSGCTSGHGVCRLGRLSPRSLAAVGVFMVAGVLTASLLRHWVGL